MSETWAAGGIRRILRIGDVFCLLFLPVSITAAVTRLLQKVKDMRRNRSAGYATRCSPSERAYVPIRFGGSRRIRSFL